MWYVHAYDLSLQSVVRYRKKGWNLDDAKDLFQKILASPGQKPTGLDKLQAIAGMGPVKKKPSRAKGAKAPKIDEDAPPLPPASNDALPPTDDPSDNLDEPDSAEVGNEMRRELARLKLECDRAFKEYKREIRPADKQARLRIYKELCNTMRAMAKDMPDAELGAKNVLPKAEVDATWTRSLMEFASALEAMPRRLSSHSIFRRLDPVAVEEVILAEVNAVKQQLRTASWIQ